MLSNLAYFVIGAVAGAVAWTLIVKKNPTVKL
jgi:hypothetical protein